MSVVYCGREFSDEDLDLVRSIAADLSTRTAIASAVCEALGWRRPDGRPKDMSARVALLRMADDSLLVLPRPRNGNGNGRMPARIEPVSELALFEPASLAELGRIELVKVDTKVLSKRWRTLIATHHYLGYTPSAGALGDRRRDRPLHRGELQGGELAPCRTDQRAGQARPLQRASARGEGRLPLSPQSQVPAHPDRSRLTRQRAGQAG